MRGGAADYFSEIFSKLSAGGVFLPDAEKLTFTELAAAVKAENARHEFFCNAVCDAVWLGAKLCAVATFNPQRFPKKPPSASKRSKAAPQEAESVFRAAFT